MTALIQQFIKANMSKMVAELKEFGSSPLKQIKATFDYLYKISTGEIPTGAKLIRDFIRNHPNYKFDSLADEVTTPAKPHDLTFLDYPR